LDFAGGIGGEPVRDRFARRSFDSSRIAAHRHGAVQKSPARTIDGMDRSAFNPLPLGPTRFWGKSPANVLLLLSN
jgi:hypothetical protein